MNKRSKDLLTKVKTDERILKSLILEYDPFGFGCPPRDEYDFLVYQILGILYNYPAEQLSSAIFNEIDKHSDKSLKTDIEVRDMATGIVSWWNEKGSGNSNNEQ